MVETRRLTELTSRLGHLLDTPEGDLVVALSGGADSATLAYLLRAVGRSFRSVHVNHGVVHSPTLEKAARTVAERLGSQLDVVNVEIAVAASFEGEARRARYRGLFDSLAPGEWALTAHTLDDQAETVLLNLLRGSGPAGLAGIPPQGVSLARPLLKVRRSEARELAGLADLPFFDDPTNLDPDFRRNALRLEFLPMLAARFNPRLVEALARTADLVRADDSHLRQEAGSVLVLTRGSSVAVAIGALSAVAGPVADRVLRDCLSRVRPPYSGTAAELNQIWAVAAGATRRASLAGGVLVSVEGPLLVFGPEPRSEPSSRPVDLGVGAHQVGRYSVVVEHLDRVCRVAPLSTWSAIFEPEAELTGYVDQGGNLTIAAHGDPAWIPGQRRLAVAWYQPRTNGYLSVVAREESGWTSSL
jgi:tRNA(Ile)-lysidine synthetase-like protein